jgi:uncharacterized membrane protein
MSPSEPGVSGNLARLPTLVRLTLHGFLLSIAAGLILSLRAGPEIVYFAIPRALDMIGLVSGGFLLLAAGGLCLSKTYAAEWGGVLENLENRPPRRLTHVVWAVGGGAFLAIGALKLCQYNTFQAHIDLADFTNVCWQTLHGRLLKDEIKGFDSYLGDHFSPILILFSPLLWIWKSALILQFAQSFFLALSVPGVYRLARSYSSSAALALALPLLLVVNPYFHRAASAYFEPSTLAVPAFVWAFVAWRSGWKKTAAFLALSTLTFKEEAPFALFGLGLYLLIKGKRRRKHGLLLTLTALVSFLIITQIVIPHYLPLPVKSIHISMFGNFGSTYPEILWGIAKRPGSFLTRLIWPPAKWMTPLWLLFSVGLLPLGAPATLIPAIVTLLPHQMSNYAPFGYQTLSVHYAAFPLALVLWSACAGLGRLNGRLRQHLSPALAFVCVVAAAGLFTPSPYVERVPLSRKRVEAAMNIIRLVPPRASVWAPAYFVAHLACRDRLKTLTDREYLHRGWFVPDCIILDGRSWSALPEGTKKDILRVLKTAPYRRAAEEEGVILLEKVNS